MRGCWKRRSPKIAATIEKGGGSLVDRHILRHPRSVSAKYAFALYDTTKTAKKDGLLYVEAIAKTD